MMTPVAPASPLPGVVPGGAGKHLLMNVRMRGHRQGIRQGKGKENKEHRKVMPKNTSKATKREVELMLMIMRCTRRRSGRHQHMMSTCEHDR